MAAAGGTRRWSLTPLPVEAVEAVRAAVGPLVEGMIEEIATDSAIYGQVLSAPEGMGIRLGIEQAIRAFLDAAERGEAPGPDTAEMWRRLGEAEFQAGRGLDALRAAFRTGTRAAWRGAAELAAESGIPTPVVISLAEAIFVFSDQLASEAIEGYLRMQSDEAGELERRRRRLAALLLDPAGHDPEALARAAALARWPLPRELAVLALPGQSPGAVPRLLSAPALVGSDSAGAFLVLPDPDGPGRRTELERAVIEQVAALGPTVPPRETDRSLRWSRLALGLRGRGGIPSRGLIRVEEHLGTLILLGDEELGRALIRHRLAAVDALPGAERDRLLHTLEAWLAHQRHTPGIAAALHVHPQTVRYRLSKLRELLGDALDSAEGRFELDVALRVRRASPGRAAPPE